MTKSEEIARLRNLLSQNPNDSAASQRLAELTARDGSDNTEPDKPKHLSFVDGVFVWNGGFETKDVPKAAGFLWHGGNRCHPSCAACAAKIGRKWWTKREANAARIVQYADVSARKALARHIGTVAASHAASASISVPAPKGLRYLPFQQAGIAYAMGRKGTLIADQMGLGKTVQALGVVNADESIRKVLCIVPASLRLNWLREAQRWLVRSFRFFVAEKSTDIPPMESDFVIINYEKLVGKGSKAFIAALSAREWDLIILDEAHYLKNPKAQRTQAVLGFYDKRAKANIPGLLHKAKRRMMLTGTPILNRPVEAQPLLGALAPKEFGHFMYFAKRYCGAQHNGWGWDFTGASNLAELQERARGCCMVRRLKSEVLKELPAKIRQVICIPPNGMAGVIERERAAYARFEEQLAELRDRADEAKASGNEEAYQAAVRALRDVGQVAFTEMAEIRHDVARAKVPAVIEHVDSALESVDKVILFAHHKDVIRAFQDHFSSWGDNSENVCVTLTGDTPMAKRQEAVDRFQTDPSVKVFIGNLKAAGVGLTLTAASTVIFAELDWVPANMSQAEDRAHRIGQLGSVLVQHLVVDGSLDARMAFALVEKQEIADRALDLGTRLNIECPIVPKAPKAKSRYPEATPEQRKVAGEAMIFLAGRCDGARALDGAGFNKFDADVGLSLALAAQQGDLTDGQVWLAAKLANRYRGQLTADVLAVLAPAQTDAKADTSAPVNTKPSAPKRKGDSFTLETCPF